VNREILVTGGRGTLGRLVVQQLSAAGAHVRLLSRRPRPPDAPASVGWVTGNVTSPAIVREAIDGVDAVVHCATNFVRQREDIVGARVLAEAALAAGGPHVVYVGIVGMDRIPFGYYRAKFAAESILAESGLPVSLLRVTQFHELFFAASRALSRSPIVPVPAGFRSQPVAASEVAERLTALALGEPVGRAPDLGGPAVHRMEDLVKATLRALGRRRVVVPIPLVGKVARGYGAGYNLAPEHAQGRVTFEEFLRQKVSA
jgi:uncharacterized protein YbjT (DUF2867 family)